MDIKSIQRESDLKKFFDMSSSERKQRENLNTIGDSIRFALLTLGKMGVQEGEELWSKVANVYSCSDPKEYCGQCGSIALRCYYKSWKDGESLEDLISNINFH